MHIADGCVTVSEKRGACFRRKQKAERLQVIGFTDHWQQNHRVKTKHPALAFTIHTLDDQHIEKPLVLVSQTAQDKASWLDALEATIAHKRQISAMAMAVDQPTAALPPKAEAVDTLALAVENLAKRKRNAQEAVRKIHSRMEALARERPTVAPLTEHWTLAGGPVDRRLGQLDDRGM
jgi:hypothetical protein